MNNRIFTLIVLVGLWHIEQAPAQEIFPLKQLKLGQASQQFFSNFPTAKVVLNNRGTGGTTNCLASLSIPSNSFWNSSMIGVSGGRVTAITYVQIEDFERGLSNAPILLRHLIQTQGTNYTRAVARHHSRTGQVDSPVFIWENPDHGIIYTFMPLEAHTRGEPYPCHLTLFSRTKKPEEFFERSKTADVERVFRPVDDILQRETPQQR